MGFGVQKSPVGPGTKPQQGSEDGVGSLEAKAGLVISQTVVSVFAVDPSFRVPLAPNLGDADAADNHLFPHWHFLGRIICDALKDLTEMETSTTRVVS